jgi:hypothetical protein
MASTTEYIGEDVKIQKRAALSGLGRTILLSVLGYEAAGCLAGGSLLIAAPDGRLMDMPVEMMCGAFSNFLIPGIILFGLGVLNTLAYISVLRKRNADWFTAGLALGGLFIWFAVEIIILQALHWLHLMWGMPVMIGWVAAIRLISLRHYTERTRKYYWSAVSWRHSGMSQ